MTSLKPYADELVTKGYQVLGTESKTYPPKGTTGKAGWINGYCVDAGTQVKFLAIRYDEATVGLDVDTDPEAQHAEDGGALQALWEQFLETFGVTPVRTGANLANGAGITHWRLGAGVTEADVATLNIANLDVLRRGHRYAVVRGTHPKSGNEYSGDLPPAADLPVLTREMLDWLLSRGTPRTYEATEHVATDMPIPVKLLDIERQMLTGNDARRIDLSMAGGRNHRLYAATKDAFYVLSASSPEQCMGKALTFIEPFLEQAHEEAESREKAKRYSSLDAFWHEHKGLGTMLAEQQSRESESESNDDPLEDDAKAVAVSEIQKVATEMYEFHKRFVYHGEDHQYRVACLWAMHTFQMHKWRHSPRLYVTGAEANVGKSKQSEMIEFFAKDARRADGITYSAMFRFVSEHAPTLIIDEADTIWSESSNENEDMRKLIDSGFTRRTAKIMTSVKAKGDWQAKEFNVYCPVVLAGIRNNKMHETITSRSVTIIMERSNGRGNLEEFDFEDHEEFMNRVHRTMEGLEQHIEMRPKPESAQHLKDRDRDVWRPLYAIAELLGPEWVTALNSAVGGQPENKVPVQNTILSALHQYFEDEDTDRVTVNEFWEWLKETFDLWIARKDMKDYLMSYGIAVRRMNGGSTYLRESAESAFETHVEGYGSLGKTNSVRAGGDDNAM